MRTCIRGVCQPIHGHQPINFCTPTGLERGLSAERSAVGTSFHLLVIFFDIYELTWRLECSLIAAMDHDGVIT
jgi:hypothetical protein